MLVSINNNILIRENFQTLATGKIEIPEKHAFGKLDRTHRTKVIKRIRS